MASSKQRDGTSQRQVRTIFCDDIRHEITGKVSFIGVYAGIMWVSQFPIILPKLCLALEVSTPANRPFKKLTITVFKDMETLATGSVSKDELMLPVPDPGTIEEWEKKSGIEDISRVFRTTFVFSPIEFRDQCALRVRVETEKGELRGTGLLVARPSGQTATPSTKSNESAA